MLWFQEFRDEVREMLLFLKRVEFVAVYQWEEGVSVLHSSVSSLSSVF
jgi:hypothetical protein